MNSCGSTKTVQQTSPMQILYVSRGWRQEDDWPWGRNHDYLTEYGNHDIARMLTTAPTSVCTATSAHVQLILFSQQTTCMFKHHICNLLSINHPSGPNEQNRVVVLPSPSAISRYMSFCRPLGLLVLHSMASS